MNEINNRIKTKSPGGLISAGRKRRNAVILLLLLLGILLLSRIIINHEKTIHPVIFDTYPIGRIWPDSDNGNLNTAQAAFTIKNPSPVTQTVTFQITYDLLLSEEHFSFNIEHLYIKDETGTFAEFPGTEVEIPGKTSLSLRITAVDRDSSTELTTRGAPEVKIISLPPESTLDGTKDYTTDTRSTEFNGRDEKLSFLARYLIMPSEMIETAYHIVYQDNSKGRVPGPSEYDIRAAFTVEKDDIPLWTEGMAKILPQQADPGWWEDLKTPEFTWEIPEDAEYYMRPDSQSYVVVCPDLSLILKMVSTQSVPLQLKGDEFPDEIPGYDQFKALVADRMGYDHSTIPYIKTVQTEQTYTADGTTLNLICYRAMFCGSPLYGIPVLVIAGDKDTFGTVLCDGSYNDEWHLADIDGDGREELLMQHLIGITGGAGAYQTDIYRLDDGSISKIFSSPDQENDTYFDTFFTLHLSEGFTHTVQNVSTGFEVSFTRRASENSPYFDTDGNITDDARENNEIDWLNADPYFYLFMPVDADGDGIYEIMTAQYTYLYGRSDSLGAAYTLLKWDDSMKCIYIAKSGFWPYEDPGNDEEEYEERWEEYENSWYLPEKRKTGNSLDSKALAEAASRLIRETDFHVRQ